MVTFSLVAGAGVAAAVVASGVAVAAVVDSTLTAAVVEGVLETAGPADPHATIDTINNRTNNKKAVFFNMMSPSSRQLDTPFKLYSE